MGLTTYKLGSFIELSGEKNSEGLYGIDDVRGINNLKEMMPSKADLNGRDLTKFQIVKPGEFVFNHRTSRNGGKFSITYNYDSEPRIFTEDYVVFHIKKECNESLLKEWLYLYFCRSEFDRFVITNSWGSSTEFFNWSDLCDIDLPLPSIQQQKRFIKVYLALQNNLSVYLSKVEDLKLALDGYLEDLRHTVASERIGQYIKEENLRNTKNEFKNVLGVCKDKTFIQTVANMLGIDLSNYKVVKPNWFAYSNRINIGSIALRYNTPCLVSPSYTVFSVDESKLFPEYLSLWLQREEFLHFAFFFSMGTIKDELSVDELGQMEIPIPSLETQLFIITLYRAYLERIAITESIKESINSICPLLIKGSLLNPS